MYKKLCPCCLGKHGLSQCEFSDYEARNLVQNYFQIFDWLFALKSVLWMLLLWFTALAPLFLVMGWGPASTVSVRGSRPLPPVIAPVPVRVYDSDNDGVIDRDDECPSTDLGFTVDNKGCAILDNFAYSLPFSVRQNIGLQQADQVLRASISSEELFSLSPGIELKSFKLTTEIGKAMLSESRIVLEIYVHTDSTGLASFNKDLSEKRGRKLADAIIQQGVSSNRVRYYGVGESQPVASNSSSEGRYKNRRVELVFLELTE